MFFVNLSLQRKLILRPSILLFNLSKVGQGSVGDPKVIIPSKQSKVFGCRDISTCHTTMASLDAKGGSGEKIQCQFIKEEVSHSEHL